MLKITLLPILLVMMLSACSTTPSFQSSHIPDSTGNSADNTDHGANNSEYGLQSGTNGIRNSDDINFSAADGNVWLRIRDSLQMNRHIDNAVVKEKIAWYARNQEFLIRMSERATPYLYYIVEELKKRDMPIELALLPVVESAYHPFAYSRSHASGIWQFIPSTGKIFGLKQNWWYDGRRDIVAATRAALDYLQKLHNEFGDWELAVAAYNTGERNIERAIVKNNQSRKKTDFFSLGLHKETRGYVPSLLAVAEIVAQPEKYGVTLTAIPNKPYFTQVETGGQLDLSTVASLTGLTMDQIYTLNPGFSRWATDPDGPHYLLLPIDKAPMFLTGLSAIPKDQRVTWNQHVIKNGETLGQIADAYKTSIAMLKETNNIKGNLIHAGQTLMIPGSKNQGKFTPVALNNPHVVEPKNKQTDEKQIYSVRSGDNLWAIGKRFNVSVKDLCAWNNLSTNSTLRLGQKLSLRNPQTVQKSDVAQASEPAKEYSKNENGHVNYTVKKGDTLWRISQAFGVTVAQLQKWNKLTKNSQLQPGQTLVLLETTALAIDA